MYCSPPEAVSSEFICYVVTSASVSFFPLYKMERALSLGTSGTYCTTRLEDKLCFDIALDE